MKKSLLVFNVNDHISHTNYQNLSFPGQSSPKTNLELYLNAFRNSLIQRPNGN